MNRSPAQETTGKDSRQREMALARWDNEGGHPNTTSGDASADSPRRASTALVQLRIRVIALENLVITLLAESSERQLDLARSMATHVAPRPGFTHHRMTLHAATQMLHLIKRAGIFRVAAPQVDTPPK
jgi:hypothetical protein